MDELTCRFALEGVRQRQLDADSTQLAVRDGVLLISDTTSFRTAAP